MSDAQATVRILYAMMSWLALPCAMASLGPLACAARLGAQREAAGPVLTLEEALGRARQANAHLPVAKLNLSIAEARLREQRGRNKPGIALDGDLHLGGPLAYTSSDARFQVIASDTLFNGGRVRSAIANTQQLIRAASAGYRVAEKDLELNVRLRFAEGLHAQRLLEVRRSSV